MDASNALNAFDDDRGNLMALFFKTILQCRFIIER